MCSLQNRQFNDNPVDEALPIKSGRFLHHLAPAVVYALNRGEDGEGQLVLLQKEVPQVFPRELLRVNIIAAFELCEGLAYLLPVLQFIFFLKCILFI